MSSEKQTLFSIFESVAIAKNENILFQDDIEECSGRNALQSVSALANGFSKLGIKKSDVIAFLCDSSVRHVLSYFACQSIGAVSCALHVRSTTDNIGKALAWLEAGLLVVDRKYKDLAYESIKIYGKSIQIVVIDDEESGLEELNYKALLGSEVETKVESSISLDDPTMIILSSGTTGDPKGIVHSQRTLYASAISGNQVFGNITAEDSVIVAMAPSFAAWNHVTLPFLANQAKIVFNRGFEASHYLKTIQHQSISHAALVPTAWRRVLSAIGKDNNVSSLRSLFFSGEAGSRDFINAIREKLPAVDIRSAYLSSEGGDASACIADNNLLSQDKLTIGKPARGANIRIIDPEGDIDDVLSQGETGEISVRSESLALGYWKNESLSKQRFVNGWWRSSDLGYMDESDNLTIAGRNDNMIITGGLKVHAEEIETALMQHPSVTLAAVIGRSDEEWGQRVEAFVINNAETSMDEINSYCLKKSLLVSFKLPKKIHFRESLPIGATGKIYRRGLLEE
jgi:acyl-CoA synthetase (AMP-forming)/AMP-acid ligase II